MSRSWLLLLTLAASLTTSCEARAQTLPGHAEWSQQPLPYANVADTYAAVKSEGEPVFAGNPDTFGHWHASALNGFWRFFRDDAQSPPTRYFRYQIVDNNPWRITISWACEESEEDCRAFQAAIPTMLPPPPPPPPPASELQGSTVSKEDMRIITQRCRDKPPSIDTTYPRKLRKSGLHGVVRLLVTLNPCGQVKRARVWSSSGNAILDEAAIDMARDWIFSREAARLTDGRGGTLVVPVDFTK